MKGLSVLPKAWDGLEWWEGRTPDSSRGTSQGRLGTLADWGRGIRWQRIEEETLAMGQVFSEAGIPQRSGGRGNGEEGSQEKVSRRRPPSGLDGWRAEWLKFLA